ncbi:hypothetical protein KAU11_10195 [Candidatus Babeliales bacterium]|nr:hypothetical protein [Candidatus Babeliales bacterium]
MDDVSLLENFGEKQVLTIIKQALIDGNKFGLDKNFNVIDVAIKNNAILVYYKSDIYNRFAIYNDFALIIGFVYSFLVGDFDKQKIFNIGVHTKFEGESELYILSPIESAKAISVGNAIFWLKNSLVNEQITYPADSYLLVEGESETEAFPILFRSIGIEIEQYKIKLITFSKHNLRTMLAVLNIKKEPFLLVCDKDKEKEISDLQREGLLDSNFHILEKGEFEDYIDPPSLINILKTFTPDIELNTDYIESNRLRGLGTSKIIAKFYHQESIHNQNPTKPEVVKKIAQYWAQKEMPSEFAAIMKRTLNLTSNNL